MTMKMILAALAATIIVASSPTCVDAKRAKHHDSARSARVQPNPGAGFGQPARMIEVKPGLWISSYGCITDDGYGRFLPCDITDSGGGR